jgi:hypothetical protein
MITAILIHELGHILLFADTGIWQGEESEHRANKYGYEKLLLNRSDLIPVFYWDYRKFFFQSYTNPEKWTKERCLAEYENWLTQMHSLVR